MSTRTATDSTAGAAAPCDGPSCLPLPSANRRPLFVTLSYAEQDAYRIAVDVVNVYWTYLSGGVVMKTPIAGGPSAELARAADRP